jgi:hypothetical protein
VPPPPLHQASHPISPELALVDRDLADLGHAEHLNAPATARIPDIFLESEAREVMLRMCELSDVNPPPAWRRPRLGLAVAVPALLWAEALILVASFVPLGAL